MKFFIRHAEIKAAQAIAYVQVCSWKAAYHDLIPDSILDNLCINQRQKAWKENLKNNCLTHVLECTATLIAICN